MSFNKFATNLLLFVAFCFVSLSAKAATRLSELNALKPPFTLPTLSYPSDSLKKAVDQETMEIHHGRHHQGYVNNLNKAVEKNKWSLQEIFSSIEKQASAVRNNAGGHWNHGFFWLVLTPDSAKNQMTKGLKQDIEKTWGSFSKFTTAFEAAGASRFGSGWVWLVRDFNGKLKITSTANQDNPLMSDQERGIPIFAIDVWEHAYYLKYQNDRGSYLKDFWQIVNWQQVEAFDKEARESISLLTQKNN